MCGWLRMGRISEGEQDLIVTVVIALAQGSLLQGRGVAHDTLVFIW